MFVQQPTRCFSSLGRPVKKAVTAAFVMISPFSYGDPPYYACLETRCNAPALTTNAADRPTINVSTLHGFSQCCSRYTISTYVCRNIARLTLLLCYSRKNSNELAGTYIRLPRDPTNTLLAFLQLTLSERMPPYSRHHKYSKKIECRHRGGKNKNNSRLLLEL